MNLGINPNDITFANLTMESDRFICIRNSTDNTLIVFDLRNPKDILKRPISADSALMHPSEFVIALRGLAVGFIFILLLIRHCFNLYCVLLDLINDCYRSWLLF
jgi:hypothetical protein